MSLVVQLHEEQRSDVLGAPVRKSHRFSVTGMTASESRRRHFTICMFLAAAFAASLSVQLPVLSWAAEAPPVAVESVQVNPAAVAPGKHPDIVASIRVRSSDPGIASRPVSIVAVLTQPDHRTKSWVWNKVLLSAKELNTYAVQKDYTTKLTGEYKIEFTVYSGDMKQRYSARSATFAVAEKPHEAVQPEALPAAAAVAPEKKIASRADDAGYLMGLGVYGNAVNPAGGATLLLWPGKYVGLQAIYTIGEFTSSEARLLGKIVTTTGWNPYLGVGYLNVSKTADVIGVSTTFTDSTVSGVLGIEIPVSRKFHGYVEVAGASVDLKKIVTNGGRTVEATVEYSPVTIGVGLVFALF